MAKVKMHSKCVVRQERVNASYVIYPFCSVYARTGISNDTNDISR